VSYFKDAKVGEKVYDLVCGEGEIVGIDGEIIWVDFLDGANTKEDYYRTGKQLDRHNQRLFYYDNRPIVITQDDLGLSDNAIEYHMCDYGNLSELQADGITDGISIKCGIGGIDRNIRRVGQTAADLIILAKEEREEEKPLTVKDLEDLYKLCENLKVKPINIDGKDYYKFFNVDQEIFFTIVNKPNNDPMAGYKTHWGKSGRLFCPAYEKSIRECGGDSMEEFLIHVKDVGFIEELRWPVSKSLMTNVLRKAQVFRDGNYMKMLLADTIYENYTEVDNPMIRKK